MSFIALPLYGCASGLPRVRLLIGGTGVSPAFARRYVWGTVSARTSEQNVFT